MELSDATEKSLATPGIDPGTFRLVAQCVNHYATPVPNVIQYIEVLSCVRVMVMCKTNGEILL